MLLNKQRLNGRNRCQAASIIIEDLNLQKKFYTVINNLTACVYCWFAILAIIGVMKKFGDRTNSFAGWMAEKSWGIYVFHYLPLAMAAYYLQPYVSELPVPMIYLLVGISAFLGALLLNGIISRIPVIRWCVLGHKRINSR